MHDHAIVSRNLNFLFAFAFLPKRVYPVAMTNDSQVRVLSQERMTLMTELTAKVREIIFDVH